MRVTNSMLVNNLMRNLNNNMNKLDKFNNQLATGRKYAHISDDPVALIYGQAARNKLARLEHYQRTIGSAQDWLRQVEYGVRDLQERVADVYTAVMDAATDVKNSPDKKNIAQLVAQLRDHYLDTLNTTFGDKFVYGGYNTPGNSSSGQFGPFRVDENWNLVYNDYYLTDMTSVDNINLLAGKVGAMNSDIYDEITSLNNDYDGIIDLTAAGVTLSDLSPGIDSATTYISDLNDRINAALKEISMFESMEGRGPGGPLYDPSDTGYNINYDPIFNKPVLEGWYQELNDARTELTSLTDKINTLNANWNKRAELLNELETASGFENREGTVPVTDFTIYYDDSVVPTATWTGIINVELTYDSVDPLSTTKIPTMIVNDTVGEVDKVEHTPTRLEYDDFTGLRAILQKDVLTFDVGPGISMPVTFNGLDLVIYNTTAEDGKPVARNIFNLLHEVYETMMSGDDPENTDKLGKLIKELQDAQNHLLTKTAEVGGRTRRLELLETRYNMDAIGYEQMRSDAEDVEEAEVIMYLKMAEAIYQASLAAGARIIQPTLMDFLR